MKKVTCIILLAVTLAGCRSIMVRGVVSDAITGEPVWPCTVSIGDRTAMADVAGRYKLSARKRPPNKRFSSSRDMEVICKGYQRQVVKVTWEKTRYPIKDVQMTPLEK